MIVTEIGRFVFMGCSSDNCRLANQAGVANKGNTQRLREARNRNSMTLPHQSL